MSLSSKHPTHKFLIVLLLISLIGLPGPILAQDKIELRLCDVGKTAGIASGGLH